MELLTIGYMEDNAMELIAAFMSDENAVLLDIRETPRSRWKPAFNRNQLIEQFGGFRYGWWPEFGNINHRPEDRHKGIVLADPQTGLERIRKVLESGRKVMLLCACKDYERCHRKVVYELIMAEMAKGEKSNV